MSVNVRRSVRTIQREQARSNIGRAIDLLDRHETEIALTGQWPHKLQRIIEDLLEIEKTVTD